MIYDITVFRIRNRFVRRHVKKPRRFQKSRLWRAFLKRCVSVINFTALVSVEGRLNRRKKYPFSNKNGYAWTGVQISKTYNNFARALGIFVSLPSLHDNDVKLLNFTFLWECEHKTTIFLFFFVFLIEIQTFRTQLAKNSLTFGKFSVMKQKR